MTNIFHMEEIEDLFDQVLYDNYEPYELEGLKLYADEVLKQMAPQEYERMLDRFIETHFLCTDSEEGLYRMLEEEED